MIRSYILTFDDTSKINTSASSGYVIDNGIIRKDTSVSEAIIYTTIKTSDVNAVSASLIVIGDLLDGATFKFKANNIVDFQDIDDNKTSITSVTTQGKEIQLQINITNNNTRIDTLGFYWK